MAQAPSDPWDIESVTDALSEAMSDVQDMDTSFGDFAKAAVRFLENEGLLRLPKPGPVPEVLCALPGYSSSPRVSVCRGSTTAPAYMAVRLNLNGGMTEASGWFTADHARRIAEAMIEQADAFEARFPVEASFPVEVAA